MYNLSGEAERQRRQQETQAREAAEKVKAEQEAAQRAALMPDEETRAIVDKHVQAAQAEIAERQKLSAQERQAEALTAELEQLATRHEQLAINPSVHWDEIQKLSERIGEIETTLQGDQAPAYGKSPSPRGRTVYIVGDEILTDDTQLSQE